MFRVFEARTADALWRSVATAVVGDSEVSEQGSRIGMTREILHAALTLSDPTQRWVVSRHPAINPAFAVAEVVWILAGRNDAKFINYYSNEYAKFAGPGPVYHGAYGYRLRQHFGFDQIRRAAQALTSKPDSRQVVLQIWDSKVDAPSETGHEASPDIPCNLLSMLKVRGGALEWTQIMRSNDIYRGLPYNIVQFTTLQEIMAGWLGLSVGAYHHISDSLHAYTDTIPYLRRSVTVPSQPSQPSQPNSDSLRLPLHESNSVLRELTDRTEAITEASVTVRDIEMMVKTHGLPPPYFNLLCLLGAEGARRRYDLASARGIMMGCKNPLYRQLFDQWLHRLDPERNWQRPSDGPQ